jgi:hypothetical protein
MQVTFAQPHLPRCGADPHDGPNDPWTVDFKGQFMNGVLPGNATIVRGTDYCSRTTT